jgi:hypothetical protein
MLNCHDNFQSDRWFAWSNFNSFLSFVSFLSIIDVNIMKSFQFAQFIHICATIHWQSSEIHKEIILLSPAACLFHLYSVLLSSVRWSIRLLSHNLKWSLTRGSIDVICLKRVRSNSMDHQCYSCSASLWMSVLARD